MNKKTILEIIFHIGFWILTFFYFTQNSVLRFPSIDINEEYFSLLLIIIVIYLNYFWLIPRFFTRQKFLYYFLYLILILLLITSIEFQMLKNDILLFVKVKQDVFLYWNYFGIFFRDTLFVGFFTMFRIYQDAIRANKLLQANILLERQQFITRIELIKSKINTHFFFNSLNSIYSLVLEKSDEAPGILINLSDLMEYVVKDSENEWVPLDDEISFLQNYIALEKIVNQNIALQIEITGNPKLYVVPPMIFEAFFNNAFKYTDFDNKGYIHINVHCNAGEIIFYCENTVFTNDNNTVKSTAKGLKNTNNRLDLLYKDRYKLDITNEEGKFKVLLVLKNN